MPHVFANPFKPQAEAPQSKPPSQQRKESGEVQSNFQPKAASPSLSRHTAANPSITSRKSGANTFKEMALARFRAKQAATEARQ